MFACIPEGPPLTLVSLALLDVSDMNVCSCCRCRRCRGWRGGRHHCRPHSCFLQQVRKNKTTRCVSAVGPFSNYILKSWSEKAKYWGEKINEWSKFSFQLHCHSGICIHFLIEDLRESELNGRHPVVCFFSLQIIKATVRHDISMTLSDGKTETFCSWMLTKLRVSNSLLSKQFNIPLVSYLTI